MPQRRITREDLKKHKGSLRGYYLAEGDKASERAANAPGSYSDIPKSDIRSMRIAERLKDRGLIGGGAPPPAGRRKKPLKRPVGAIAATMGVVGLIEKRQAVMQRALGR